MVDIARPELDTAAAGAPAVHAAEQYESDFSARKIRIACVVLLGTLFGSSILPFASLSLVLVPMTKEFGWTVREFTYATTALMWVGACTVPFLGHLADRIGVRPIIITGTVVVGLVTMSVSLTHGLPTFLASFALLGFFGSVGVVYSKVLAGLFTVNRGKALAIFGAESAVALALAPQLVRLLLDHFGWRGLFLTEGLIIIGVVPFIYFILHEPGTQGGSRHLLAYWRARRGRAATDLQAASAAPAIAELDGHTIRQVLISPTFWIVVLGSIVASLPFSVINPLIGKIMPEHGFSGSAPVANYLSVGTLAGIIGALSIGYLLDKVHSAKIAIPFLLCGALGAFLVNAATAAHGGLPLMFAGAALLGINLGSYRPTLTYFNTRFFGLRSFGAIAGIEAFPLAIAMGAIAPLVAWSAEITGSYRAAILATVIALVLGSSLYLLLGRYRYSERIGALPSKKK
jgi:MFS family permease